MHSQLDCWGPGDTVSSGITSGSAYPSRPHWWCQFWSPGTYVAPVFHCTVTSFFSSWQLISNWWGNIWRYILLFYKNSHLSSASNIAEISLPQWLQSDSANLVRPPHLPVSPQHFPAKSSLFSSIYLFIICINLPIPMFLHFSICFVFFLPIFICVYLVQVFSEPPVVKLYTSWPFTSKSLSMCLIIFVFKLSQI